MVFIGGNVSGAQASWTRFEKEAYALFRTFGKVVYLLIGKSSIPVFKVHRNFQYVFDASSVSSKSPHHVLANVHRWAIYFPKFSFTVEQISGNKNVFLGMITRWSQGNGVRKQQWEIHLQNTVVFHPNLRKRQ